MEKEDLKKNKQIGNLETNKNECDENRQPRSYFRVFLENPVSNLNAALVNVIVSIPTSLAIMFTLNSEIPKSSRIDPSVAALSLIFSFFMSFVINGGTSLFKSFTASQAFILILQIREFGAQAVAWTCLVTSIFLVIIVMLQIQKFVKMTPKCIVCGLKFSTGKISIFIFFQKISKIFFDKI